MTSTTSSASDGALVLVSHRERATFARTSLPIVSPASLRKASSLSRSGPVGTLSSRMVGRREPVVAGLVGEGDPLQLLLPNVVDIAASGFKCSVEIAQGIEQRTID